MSGGYFNHKQNEIRYIADEIEKLIWDDEINLFYSKDTIQMFKEGLNTLRAAYIYAQRIDFLVSHDDSQDDFHERLVEDFSNITLE